MKTSSYSGFFKLSTEERLREVAEFAGLDEKETAILGSADSLDDDKADHMIENVIGKFALPMGVAINFVINGKDVIIPMVTEEPSVVAACSNAAKMARPSGGFKASSSGNVMIAQIQVLGVAAPFAAKSSILERKDEIIRICNEKDPVLVNFGGGVKDVEVRVIDTMAGPMVIVHLLVDTLDAMGANAVNTMAEAVAPYIEEITEGSVELRILSNLADRRLVRVRATWKKEDIGGTEVVDKMLNAYAFAAADPYRAATHNKGNDERNSPSGHRHRKRYQSHRIGSPFLCGQKRKIYISDYLGKKDENGDLVGSIEIPMAVGLVGGATKIHPAAQAAVKILGVKSAAELGQIIAAAGLANNMAAMKALATEGIQRGHMSLHARNLANTVGAKGEILETIVKQMVRRKKVRLEYAQELFDKYSR